MLQCGLQLPKDCIPRFNLQCWILSMVYMARTSRRVPTCRLSTHRPFTPVNWQTTTLLWLGKCNIDSGDNLWLLYHTSAIPALARSSLLLPARRRPPLPEGGMWADTAASRDICLPSVFSNHRRPTLSLITAVQRPPLQLIYTKLCVALHCEFSIIRWISHSLPCIICIMSTFLHMCVMLRCNCMYA